MEGIIGIEGTDTKGSLREFGVSYRQVDLVGDSEFDYAGIKNALNEKTKLVTIQRSKGYAMRKTLSVERIGELIRYYTSVQKGIKNLLVRAKPLYDEEGNFENYILIIMFLFCGTNVRCPLGTNLCFSLCGKNVCNDDVGNGACCP